MKTIVLIRHAKSDWGNDALLDFDRHLNTRGYEDAYRSSKSLLEKKIVPDCILSSPAVRAFTTAVIFARAFSISENTIKLEKDIYEAKVSALVKVLKNIDNAHNTVFMFGHNPGFTDLFNEISNSDIDNVPTCGIMAIKFNVDSWKNLTDTKGEFLFSSFPKEFK